MSRRIGSKTPAGLVLAISLACYGIGLYLATSNPSFPTANDAAVPVWITFALVGAIIIIRGTSNRVGWYCLAVGFCWGLETLFFGLYYFGVAHPDLLANPELYAAIADPLWVFGIFAIATFVPLYFPTGELHSPRWRWVPRMVWAGILAQYPLVLMTQPATASYGRPTIPNPLVATSLGSWMADREALFVGLSVAAVVPIFVGVGLSIASLVIRYRHAQGVERQQLRWFTTAGTATILIMVVAIFLTDYLGDQVGLFAGACLVLIPISIGVAIFRYRLYDVDRIVSRTITYTVVAGVLAAVYAAVVIVVPLLMPATLDSPMLVAGATLIAAAVFNPMRRRVHSLVERRFNRSRYDAQAEFDLLVQRLGNAHSGDDIASEVMGVVNATMGPDTVSVWIRPVREDAALP